MGAVVSVWEGLVSAGFFVMLVLTVWAWIENRSLRDQLAEARTARVEQSTRAHHLGREVDLTRGMAKAAALVADERLHDKRVVEDMNRILTEDVHARKAAAEARRQKRKET